MPDSSVREAWLPIARRCALVLACVPRLVGVKFAPADWQIQTGKRLTEGSEDGQMTRLSDAPNSIFWAGPKAPWGHANSQSARSSNRLTLRLNHPVG